MTDTPAWSDLFLSCGGAAEAYPSMMAAAVREVASAYEETNRPTSAQGFRPLRTALQHLPVLPDAPVGLEQVLREVRAHVLDHLTMVSHPEYVAHLHCPPILPALAAEVLISATNQSMDSFDQGPSATAMERHVIDWFVAECGFAGGDGVFTSGGTQSNLMGLLLARDAHAMAAAGWSVAERGLPPAARTWRIACSPLSHFSVVQAMSVLGLGDASVLTVGVDAEGRMDPVQLRRELDASLARGEKPIAVVCTAGTTELGSVDPIAETTEVARAHGLWVHVDAAAGGAALFSPRRRRLLNGLEAADSVAIDGHKLLFQPISCGLFLLRDAAHYELLRRHADYLNPEQDELAGTPNLVAKSLQTTRRFDALKVFMTMRMLGRQHLAELIDATMDTASAAGEFIEAHADLALLAPVASNTVALRFQVADRTAENLDAINSAIVRNLAGSGTALLGRTRYGGRVAIKLTFVNPLTTPEHARRLVGHIAAEGTRLAAGELKSTAHSG